MKKLYLNVMMWLVFVLVLTRMISLLIGDANLFPLIIKHFASPMMFSIIFMFCTLVILAEIIFSPKKKAKNERRCLMKIGVLGV